MKLLIRGFWFGLTAISCCLIFWNIAQKDAIRENAERGLKRSIEQTVREVKVKKMYEFSNSKEFEADFIKTFAQTSSTMGDVDIKFYGSDEQRGFLDIEVTKKFVYPSGQHGSIVVRSAVITEDYPK